MLGRIWIRITSYNVCYTKLLRVSRSIAACEGALLIVDATQGIQAQTISNLYQAIEHDLEIIPVLNKMDLPNAMPEEVEDQIIDLIGCDREDIIRASGKTGVV